MPKPHIGSPGPCLEVQIIYAFMKRKDTNARVVGFITRGKIMAQRLPGLSRRDALKLTAASSAGALLGAPALAAQTKKPLVLDAQVHSYDRNGPQRPWAAFFDGPTEVTGDQMVACMDEAGVDGAIMVSVFTIYKFDTSYMEAVYAKHPTRFKMVKPVDVNDPAAPEQIAAWAPVKGAASVRVLLMPGVTSEDAADPKLSAAMAAAAKHSIPVNIHCPGRLEQAAQLAKRNPNTQLIIDHLGLDHPLQPPKPAGDLWGELPKLLACAAYPNVTVKLSATCNLSHEQFPFNDIWGPLARIIDAFGVNRCMWGTDWTRSLKLLTYKQQVDTYLQSPRLSDSDRAAIMSGTLARVYKWPQKA